MKMILSNHNSDIFLKNFSPEEIFEINSAKKGFPDVLERILKDNEQIALYKKSLHEIKPNLLFSYLKKLATRTVIIESCISDVKRIIKKDISLF